MRRINPAFWLLLMTPSAWSQVTIEVFTDWENADKPETKNYTVTHYALKEGEHALEQFNIGMPNTEEEARIYATKKFEKVGDELNLKIVRSAQGQILFERYRLKMLPAYVFNKKVVLYGHPTLETAIEEYEQWASKE